MFGFLREASNGIPNLTACRTNIPDRMQLEIGQ